MTNTAPLTRSIGPTVTVTLSAAMSTFRNYYYFWVSLTALMKCLTVVGLRLFARWLELGFVCVCVCVCFFYGNGTRQLSLDKLRMTFGELYEEGCIEH